MRSSSLLVRLGIIAAVVAAGIVGIFAALLHAVGTARDAVDETRRVDAVLASAAELESQALALQNGTRGYVISGSRLFLRPSNAADRAYPQSFAELERLVVAPGQRALLGRLQRELEAYVREWQAPLVATAGRDLERARALVRSGEGERRMNAFRDLLAQFVRAERRIEARVTGAAERTETRAERWGYGGLAALLLLVLGALAYVWRAVVAPVDTLAAATHAVAAGDLDARAPERGAGEVAELARDFNAMVDALALSRAELAERTQRLYEAQQLESLGVLAGGIAHDFNNLLTAVLGNATLLLQDASLAPETRSSVEQIELAATRAAELTKQMLAYSGKGRFVIRPVDIRALLEEMKGLLAGSIPREAALELDLAADLAAVEADAAQLRQVLINLIVNAAEALEGRPGLVTVRASPVRADRELLDSYRLGDGASEGDYIAIEVSDTGSGMDADTMERILDPFFTTKFTGRGLGLAAVLGIVRGHGGALRIESERGRGTTVRLLLPAATEAARRRGEGPRTVSFEP